MSERHRTLEERRVLNAAFAGALIGRTATSYREQANEGMPFYYAYLVLPIVLHTETRERLPKSVVTRLMSWTDRNPELTATFLRRVADLRNVSREALLLITSSGAATFGTAGRIEMTSKEKLFKSSSEPETTSSDVKACYKRATFLGRWLAVSGAPAAVLTSLGVRF